ncbi:MAG: efflux RND transporter periplasmic adaptor subunit [Bacteroidetes bacterium]|nr:efflux RND transporter periplasmic adaptor subunit [Bacteroidota bacterium]
MKFSATFPILIPVFLFASILSSCKGDAGGKDKASGNARPKGITAEGYVVKETPYASTYVASGNLIANEMLELHPEVSGRVTQIFFKEGAQVRKGQLLVQLNDADVRAQIAKLRAQRQLQVLTQSRQNELLKIGGISQQDYDATRTTLQGIDADIAVNEAQLTRLRIVAPFDGVVGLRNISPGAIVSPSTIVATLQQLSPLKMDFDLPAQYSPYLHLGQSVQFYVDGNRDTSLGRIEAIEPGADPSTRTIKARAIVPNAARKLLPGTFAHVTIAFGSEAKTIQVPSQCIIPTTHDKKVVLLKSGLASMQVVATGDRNDDSVQITSGLQPGDTILTTGLMQVKPGMPVKVVKLGEM